MYDISCIEIFIQADFGCKADLATPEALHKDMNPWGISVRRIDGAVGHRIDVSRIGGDE